MTIIIGDLFALRRWGIRKEAKESPCIWERRILKAIFQIQTAKLATFSFMAVRFTPGEGANPKGSVAFPVHKGRSCNLSLGERNKIL
jgi:hypothetical protein